VTDYYSPSSERTVLWNDTVLAIPWPIGLDEVVMSNKDRAGRTLSEAELFA